MYFPYVFGRASELLALRSTSQSCLSSGLVVPIVEPVITKPAALIKAMTEIGQRGQRAVIVTNPYQGELKAGASAAWLTVVDATFAAYPTLVPGFMCRPGVPYAEVQAFLAKYANRDVAILHLNSGLSNASVNSLAQVPNAVFHIVLQGKAPSAHLALLPHAKTVHVNDNFNKQPRNADYSGQEHFTDHHRLYSQFGVGFGDYTVTGAEIQLGGGPPGAVAVHLTYKCSNDGNLWMQHFVSDDVDIGVGTTEGKFLQAISKFAGQYHSRVAEFGTNGAINDYLQNHNNSHFPGLGKNKERQIHHHIERVNYFLLTGN
ncbi:sce7725 family protein [Massilia sp. 9096]|uniref:sce7725 family protein n=1 Tax=Massilia sp. 9096 TaxID=1500894 RepID=UPI00055E21AA|nr:sce7725 family protein [Massilia sp. 9096]